MKMRRSRQNWFVMLGVFMMVFAFTFLVQRFNSSNEVDAANMGAFDPGYIISDYQMGNYGSMNEGQIQAFLKSKVNCNDTAIWQTGNNVGYLSESTPYSWHVAGGHYVCMADENFNGESAAHIIWQAAQDYRINPQALIVLLQKEQGLVTDSFPNSVQYRSAMGYGCPDTAACSSKYYGFKNQVRNAAALFREVLDGGWTNYPLGNNYVRYNPNAACGGSTVNIRSLATSALYRYTPYQPNGAALSSSYGGGDGCSAYGNRNFYSYFEDWFGGITSTGYVGLETPRYMVLKGDTERINPLSGGMVDVLPAGMIRKYVSKTRLGTGEWCLRTEHSTKNDDDACIKLSDLKEVELVYQDISAEEQKKVIVGSAKKVGIRYGTESSMSSFMIRNFVKKTTFQGVTYYITEYDDKYNKANYGIPEEYLKPAYVDFNTLEGYVLKNDTERVDPYTGEVYDKLEKGRAIMFGAGIVVNGVKYYQTENNRENYINASIKVSDLVAFQDYHYEEFLNPREMVIKQRVSRINPYTGEYYDTLESGKTVKFATKIFLNGQWYYRTEHNTINNINAAVPAYAVKEKK